MKIPSFGLAGPVLAFANAVNAYLDGLSSVRSTIVQTLADLPNATANQGRQFIVRDINGAVFALDGAWIDSTGAAVA